MTRYNPLLLLLAACAGPVGAPGPVGPAGGDSAAPARPDRLRVETAEGAFRSGWMPLEATGVMAFRRRHLEADGRGVLIAILDSGVDPTIPGLTSTSTGARKIVDLRDFSGEGRVALAPARVVGDSVEIAGRLVAGAARVLGRSVTGRMFAGVVAEIDWGAPRWPAEGQAVPSDLNGNGRLNDTLPVVVTRTAAGWGLFTDTNGDRSLADERPVLDFLGARESFGWRTGEGSPPMGVAVNLRDGSDAGGPPVLDLYVNTSAHGSHVAGIAAGHDIYGVPGFDGVAPGAQLLGLKIANNARGGVSVSGSMVAAMTYAIDYAARYELPLVINLSFGVGNEREGTARIDLLVDSILARHPEVTLVVSAGNDGPGLSTMGFPATAGRALTVGGSFPIQFLRQPASGPALSDPIAFFSSRGGEAAKPDVVAPAVAYSTVPAWDTGNERNAGTSMAAPHVSGAVALLISALRAAGVPFDAALLRRALTVTARPLHGTTILDDGSGIIDLPGAYRWLIEGRRRIDRPVITMTHFEVLAEGQEPHPVVFQVPVAAEERESLTTVSDAPWLRAVGPIATGSSPGASVTVTSDGAAIAAPGLHTATLTGWGVDREEGPVFRLATAWIRPYPATRSLALPAASLGPGDTRRVFFRAEADRPFRVRVASESALDRLFTSLHEPGGRPYRGENGLAAGPREEAAVYQLDARDVMAGVYEIDAVASPVYSGVAFVEVDQSAFRLAATRDGSELIAAVTNVDSVPARWLPRAALLGAAAGRAVTGTGPGEVRLPIVIPGWAHRVEIDVSMEPEAWSRYTDFGVALLDEAGRTLGDGPLDYSFGRLGIDLGNGETIDAEVALLPGFAEVDSAGTWTVTVSMRIYAAAASALEPALGGPGGARSTPRVVAAGARDSASFRLLVPPWPLPEGFAPLGVVVVETEGPIWSREVVLHTAEESGR